MEDKSEPAFPRDHAHDGHNGMTLRDYFAAKAMQGMLANPQLDVKNYLAKVGGAAYEAADALLKARDE
jgi:hypothetical protein